MSTASMKKRVRAALGGLALLTLSAAFNSAAMADEATPPAPAPVTETVTVEEAPPIVPTVIMTPAPTAAEAALNAAVAADMVAIGEAMKTAYEADPRYDAAADSAVQQQIDDLITRVNSGANGNVFPQPDGLSVLGGAGMSSFATAVSIAVDTGRVDLVNAFIDAGADVSQIAPDGWRPMDYAISSFINGQATNRAHAEAAFAIIRVLESHGAKMSDAVEVGKLFTPDGQPPMVFDTYGKLINNLIGMDVVQRAVAAPADITVQGRTIPLDAQQALFGTQETAVDLSDEVRLRRAFILNNGGRLIHETYTDAYPGGAEQHTVMTGETLVNLATRYYAVMGERSPLHAMSRIMQANDLPADSRLRRGQRILIPVSENIQIGMIQAREEMDIRDLAEDIINMGTFYIPGATKDVIIRELARVNGIPEADIVSGTYKHPRGKPFIMLYDNDTFRHMQPLTPPTDIDPNRRIDLVIIEQQDGEDYHRKRTYGAATATAYAINRDVDMLRFFAWQEHLMSYPPELRDFMRPNGLNSSALNNLLANPNNPLRDNLVFSQSMEVSVGGRGGPPKPVVMEEVWQGRNAFGGELEDMRWALEILERAAPIVFTAAGNQYANGEGPFKQSFGVIHGPRTYVVGAAGRYPVFVDQQLVPAYVMSQYSTAGADVCAPLPYYLSDQQEGTSFSTPLMTALYRQMSEWYGHRLTTEEIMAAALMTANRNVLDYDDPLVVGQSMFPAQYRAHMAVFNTNGAGLPHHHRCGAGVVDIERWNETLQRMVELKMAPATNGAEFVRTVAVGQPVQTPDEEGNGQFVYRVTVPEAMTTGKLTFLLPQYQGEHTDISVRMPSGFTSVLPRSFTDAISTHAFAYEDLAAGSVIEIISDKALGPTADMTLRGFTGNNAVAQLRNELRANGTLPAPLTTLGGQEASSALLPTPPAGANDNVSIDEMKANQPLSLTVDPETGEVQAPEGQGESNDAEGNEAIPVDPVVEEDAPVAPTTPAPSAPPPVPRTPGPF